jgi:hypothetical protein
MLLRNHPRIRYGKFSNWPPFWISLHPKGTELSKEVGVLTEVRKSQFRADRLVLVMEYEEDLYGAAVTFSDVAFCNRIFELLKNSVGLSIEDIGNIDLSHTL